MPIETFNFTDAERDAVPLLIGLFGPTGGGKTNTSLRLARGIQLSLGENAGPIALIDTENGRAGIYAPGKGQKPTPPITFAFKRLDLGPPFTPMRFKGAVEAAALLGPSCLIIDQITSEWTGRGGILEFHDDETDRLHGNSHAAWNKPKRGHTQMMAVLEQLQCPIIFNFRAREKTKQEGNRIINLGWRAISEPALPYQMLFLFLVGIEGPGKMWFDRALTDQAKTYSDAAGIFEDGELGTEEVGKRLAMWAAGK